MSLANKRFPPPPQLRLVIDRVHICEAGRARASRSPIGQALMEQTRYIAGRFVDAAVIALTDGVTGVEVEYQAPGLWDYQERWLRHEPVEPASFTLELLP
jgi:hypothetical protein